VAGLTTETHETTEGLRSLLAGRETIRSKPWLGLETGHNATAAGSRRHDEF
jgi:hypothetical protein